MQQRQKVRKIQQGMTLIMLVFLIGLAATALMLNAYTTRDLRLDKDKKTAAVLAEAKAALVGYLVYNPSKPGSLPCPDTDNDGSANTSGLNSCAAYIGRLPWKQLGLAMPKDADGECLWYAISPKFRNQMTSANRVLNPLNTLTAGTLNLVNDAGVSLAGGVNPAIAVVISPGRPLSGQTRDGTATTYCPGDSVASSYLDSRAGVNNATGNVAGENYTFVMGNIDDGFNDKISFITPQEIYPILRKRMIREVLGNLDTYSGPADHYDDLAQYPCPSATSTGNQDCGLPAGTEQYVPYNDGTLGLQYSTLGTWLEDNGWFSLARYTFYSPTQVRVTLTDGFGSNHCDANANIFTCS